MISSQQEVVIVGGGVAGCSIAYHLAKQGIRSQIIEKDAIASQASGKAWGIFGRAAFLRLLAEGNLVPEGGLHLCACLSEEGYQRIPEIAQELKEEGGIDIHQGELPIIRAVFAEDDEKRLRERIIELEKDGFEYTWIEVDEIKAKVPDIAGGVRRGIIWPAHQVEAYRYTLALAQAAEAKGSSIKQGEVVGLRHKGTRVTSVLLDAGEIETDAVVLAMGPWTGQGVSWLGQTMPLEVHRDQCLVLEVPVRLPPIRVTSSLAKGVSIVPKVDGKVILGRVEHDQVDFDERPTEGFRLSILEAALATIPKLEDARVIEHRAGLEAWQPNGGQPMLGRVPGFDNVYMATWLATFGIQWSPAVGRIMADLVATGSADRVIEPFTPAKYLK
jgi:glycine oxidase